MALLPPSFLDSVVAIGTINEKNENVWIATGFLIGMLDKINDNGTKKYFPYLVTNKHVLKDLKKIVIKFNPQTDQAAKDYIIDAVEPNGNVVWTAHPNSEYDVAVISISGELLEKDGLKFGLFVSDGALISIEGMKEREVMEGDFIYVLGFPMGLVGTDRQHVILRQGVVARIRDLFEKRNTDFIIDATVFPGNSGGPVILKPELISIGGTKPNPQAGLIGIIKSYIPYQDVAISQQTNRPRIIFEENSGLTLVEPVDHILEAIEEDKKKKRI